MNLFMNWFRTENFPSGLDLPSSTFSDWRATSETFDRMQSEGFHCYRIQRDDEVDIVLCFGPTPPVDWIERSFSSDGESQLFLHLIDESIAQYLESRTFDVRRTRFEVLAFPSQNALADELISARAGISAKSMRFGREYGVSIYWKVDVRFEATLEDSRLDAIATDAPVLSASEADSDEVHVPFGKPEGYIGIVKEVESPTHVLVRCRDGTERSLERKRLRLESTQRTLRRYERHVMADRRQQQLWHRIQELSYSLDRNRKRNLRVLRDRMDAIRRFLVPDNESGVELPFRAYGEQAFYLNMNPAGVKVMSDV